MESAYLISNDFIFFILSCIVEPNIKVYYVAEGDVLICTNNKSYARKYVSRSDAQYIVEYIKNKFDLDFEIERL